MCTFKFIPTAAWSAYIERSSPGRDQDERHPIKKQTLSFCYLTNCTNCPEINFAYFNIFISLVSVMKEMIPPFITNRIKNLTIVVIITIELCLFVKMMLLQTCELWVQVKQAYILITLYSLAEAHNALSNTAFEFYGHQQQLGGVCHYLVCYRVPVQVRFAECYLYTYLNTF